MDFQDQLQRYFGTTDVEAIPPAGLAAGIEHAKVDLGLMTDPGRRFALWTLLYMLGDAPDLEATFKDATDRDAARDFMDMVDRMSDEE